MEHIIRTGTLLVGALFVVTACNSNSGVSQADLDAVRQLAQESKTIATEAQQLAQEGKTMAAEARDIALRADQKADQALSHSHP